MGQRVNLGILLQTILGSSNVYYQPPPSTQMSYPCIVYKLSKVNTDHANNKPYRLAKRYTITIIDSNPDSLIPDKIALLPTAAYTVSFPKDNLNHTVYDLYF